MNDPSDCLFQLYNYTRVFCCAFFVFVAASFRDSSVVPSSFEVQSSFWKQPPRKGPMHCLPFLCRFFSSFLHSTSLHTTTAIHLDVVSICQLSYPSISRHLLS